MSVIKMKRVLICGHNTIKTEVLDYLQEIGVVEITELEPDKEEKTIQTKVIEEQRETITELEHKVKDLEFAINYLEPYKPKKSFWESLDGDKILLNSGQWKQLTGEVEEKADNIPLKCREYADKISGAENHRMTLEHTHNMLLPAKNLDINLDEFKKFKYVEVIMGSINKENNINFNQAIKDVSELTYREEVSEDENNYYMILYIHKADIKKIEDILKEYNFEILYFDLEGESIPEHLTNIEEELSTLGLTIEVLQNQSRELCYERSKFMKEYDYLTGELDKLKIQQSFLHTKHTFIIKGWIPVLDEKKLFNLKGRYEFLEIETSKPEQGEEIPVVLNNIGAVSPFEMVTELYSLPKYKEIDPTPYFAFFFALFFGVCLTEAGYGILIMLIAGFFLLRFRLTGGTKKLMQLLLLAGGVAIVIGWLAGGWFGIPQEKLPHFLRPTGFDPLKDAMIFFYIALALGFIHIFFGYSIKLVLLFKQKSYAEAILCHLPWLVILLSILQFIYAGISKGSLVPGGIMMLLSCLFILAFGAWRDKEDPGTLSNMLKYQAPWFMFVLGLFLTIGSKLNLLGTSNIFFFIGIILTLTGVIMASFISELRKDIDTGEMKKENPFIRIAAGLYELYGVSGILGDILSYARLLALGLATGIIAGVINTLAGLVMQIPIPIVNVILALLLLIIGHIVNLGINAMGSFVHTTRLQFVEFFGKFYEGGGYAFEPFHLKRKYTVLTKIKD